MQSLCLLWLLLADNYINKLYIRELKQKKVTAPYQGTVTFFSTVQFSYSIISTYMQ
ncbi:hypothetical protein Pedsa_3374 [Pseudopedobacter saltans DSM 12145]|uniref:Uncharacterized protein n=1 Tax=Pseudopedobacter saltans (strain ATCC 51119 / DSM 12145 / JCM 21818 / CCUG 39354 / LMG 10337 / NBRC 100064 / NCIMB 13643) TaxID=762903 RepID=F0SCR5_PSESL|nr:hypothetical protein Pedsa_3374 [Pseudopedobacter saltans DSM 12145]